MAHVLAAASSFFGRTNISQSYNIGNPSQTSRPSTPGTTSGGSSGGGGANIAPLPFTPTFYIGLWKVQPATHKVTGKRVSVWSFDKRGPEMERLGVAGKDRVLEVLKNEASALSRLRHPSILEMVEPLEETRIELVFATEPVLSSLELSIPGSGRHASLVELDEIEIQKGILQLAKGLSFLHSQAQLIHSNICPESIIINSSGDWKISGLGVTIPLLTNGNPTRWEFPTFDGRVPAYIQRSFDYMAPEYALDEQLLTSSDMYSLGCVVYAVHSKGNPPFKNHGSLSNLRENAGKPLPGMERWEQDLQSLVRSLVTRHATSRPTPQTLSSHPFFSSLPISTLNFLDRSNFTAKTREEKISFMKGLTGVLNRFSEGLQTRKILPSLLEEMKDTHLLPYILPNVFAISQALSPTQFASMVLPSLKPLFAIKEPPQNMLTLLDNLGMLQEKTEKNVFKDHVLPLVYNALESEHAIVQERALKAVPDLCETVDYAEVQGVLFPRVAVVFSKTRILSVKVATLVTFLAMVKTLDQSSLTQKLVPLLSKIRTKEPSVMMATLDVQEAMGFKVDREAVATLVLPQLWAMSMGPLLNVSQFQRFMSVIKKLGERVEREHDQFLRDSQRLEDRSATATMGNGGVPLNTTTADFETLVSKGSAMANGGLASSAVTATPSAAPAPAASWEDDVWGSLLNGDQTAKHQTPTVSSSFSSPSLQTPPVITPSLSPPQQPSRPNFQPRPSKLGTSQPASRLSSSSFGSTASTSSKPNYNITLSTAPITTATPSASSLPPAPGFSSPAASSQPSYAAPNYNINLGSSLTTQAPSIQPSVFSTPLVASTPAAPISMGIGGNILTPSKPAQPAWGAGGQKQLSKADWGDFDPLA
ncbi:other/SCY1 protein kinase [Coprinopsis cinerea okayama7|uniref:Other/SCY1 protein kinase n=1 Tax=Coprinopsis cinerea (strain Okayama-7 / 130 / ATCC MYA-4618 / FGSC 9003) TaxID=240176 RepID=A8NG27_COPC7|nr:other/SCY1 protein kinase [Coprinopsis cinerea okayama7\|eukprot:XP_001833459.1 other/SCY1 protein kinase [Coprinopsis cinerea okayama7\